MEIIKFKEITDIQTANNKGENAKIFDIYDQNTKVGALYFDNNHESWLMATNFWTENTQVINLKETDLKEAKKTVTIIVKELQKDE